MTFRIPVLVCALVAATALISAQPNERFTMALTGDSIITRALSVYEEPEFLGMIDLIRSADVAFTNVEMLFHDYQFYPMASSGGTWMRAQPELAKELAWAGFDLGSLANNHAGDYGPPALLLTAKYMREAGLTPAGAGKSLAEAREAKFVETANGRVAFIAVSSTFPAHAAASVSRDDIPPRPGMNPLRVETTYHLTRERLETVRAMMEELSMDVPANLDSVEFLRNRFVLSDEAGVSTAPNIDDMNAIAAVVSNASRQAEYTIVTIHAHEGDGSRFVPAQFLETFAHGMIDAGADVFVGHGPHVLRGIEMYRGKPIFYSLGDFLFQNETLQRLPYENYARFGLGPDKGLADFNDVRYQNDTIGFPAIPEIWESVIAVPVFEGPRLVELRLHPITLGHGQPRTVRGRPMFAGDALGRKILMDAQRLSEPFGTKIEAVDGVGFVLLDEATSN